MAATGSRYWASAAFLSLPARVSRKPRITVRRRLVWVRLRSVRRSVWRARLIAEKWLAMLTSGAKTRKILGRLIARLKACPFKEKSAEALRNKILYAGAADLVI